MSRRIQEILKYDPRVSPDYAEPQNWEVRTCLMGIRNRDLLRHTDGEFPRHGWSKDVPRDGTHPMFLVERIGNWGWKFYPCSSSEGDGDSGNAATCSFIRKDTLMLRTGNRMPMKTYLIHQTEVNLEIDNNVAGREHYFGVVPESGIVVNAYYVRKKYDF